MKVAHAAPLALLALIGLAAPLAMAQDAKKAPPPNPVGAGVTWGQTVTKESGVAGEEFDKKQLELIQKVSTYFNQMGDLKGTFVQTSPDTKRIRGKFYFKRPGKFRFDYASPSKQIILSDGQYLVIQDLDLKTDDRIALDQTPFRVLMRKDVDLLRDARITEVQDVDDVIVLSLQDKAPDNPGRIKLFLGKKPGLELKEWITTDSQGLDTRIELVDVIKAEDLDANMFRPLPVALQKIQ